MHLKLNSFDPLLRLAGKIILKTKIISPIHLQRVLQIGFARACRIISQLQSLNIISTFDGVNPRKVLVSQEELQVIIDELKEAGITESPYKELF